MKITDNKQADVLRDEAIVLINNGDFKNALEKLKLAYSIRPQGHHIRLLLIKSLIRLKHFNEVSDLHQHFLTNPPNDVLNRPSLNDIFNEIHASFSNSNYSKKLKTYKGLHDEAKKLSVEEWIDYVGKSTEEHISLCGLTMPSAPPPEK